MNNEEPTPWYTSEDKAKWMYTHNLFTIVNIFVFNTLEDIGKNCYEMCTEKN